MKARELMEKLLDLSPRRIEDTVDTLKAGDPDKEVHKVATCFIASVELIREAAAWGADLIIAHEPTFYAHRDDVEDQLDDPVIAAKKALLRETGLTVYRYHDHAHSKQPDVIIDGVFRKLGWEVEFTGYDKPAYLKVPMTARQMAADFEQKLGVRHVRVAGELDKPATGIAPMFGSPGEDTLEKALRDPRIQVVLAGEVSEWRVCEYARDAAALGMNKAVLALGHAGSERDGMDDFRRILLELDPGLTVRYFDSGEVYRYPGDKA